MPVLMFAYWVLNEIWIRDLSSALVGKLMSSSKLFFISNEAYLNSSVLPSLLFVCEINSGIRIYQFTLELLYFCFRIVVLVSDFKKNLGVSPDLHTPIHPLSPRGGTEQQKQCLQAFRSHSLRSRNVHD